jgi:hypothetical protein
LAILRVRIAIGGFNQGVTVLTLLGRAFEVDEVSHGLQLLGDIAL